MINRATTKSPQHDYPRMKHLDQATLSEALKDPSESVDLFLKEHTAMSRNRSTGILPSSSVNRWEPSMMTAKYGLPTPPATMPSLSSENQITCQEVKQLGVKAMISLQQLHIDDKMVPCFPIGKLREFLPKIPFGPFYAVGVEPHHAPWSVDRKTSRGSRI